MSKRKAPYQHPDGSNCWTENCSLGHSGKPDTPAEVFNIPSIYRPELFPKKVELLPGAWSEKDTVLFRTIHGSKLYGLDHADSDEDWYVITPTMSRMSLKRLNSKHRISGDQDTTFLNFDSFTSLAMKGVPQALEAMFSRKAVSPFFEEYRQGFYASDPEVVHTYMRTIKSFSLDETGGYKGFKLRRHALRLSLNLEELLYTGRFNPTLDKNVVTRITNLAQLEGNRYLNELAKVSPIEVDWRFDEPK